MTLLDDTSLDPAQDVFERADPTKYQCGSCNREFLKSRMVRKFVRTDKACYEYSCPFCEVIVVKPS